MYHELGHDILNLRHGEGGKMMFTRPTKPNYSWEDFLNDKSVMFKIIQRTISSELTGSNLTFGNTF